jgi:hypothetical protein
MTALREISVSQAGCDFVRDRLAHGNTLAEQVLKNMPLEAGQITTLLPAGTVLQSKEEFGLGGKLPAPPVSEWKGLQSGDETLLMIPVPHTDSWLATKVKDYLAQARDRVCVVEDAIRRPADASLHRLSTRRGIYKGEIYHLLFHEDAQEERILETIKAAKSVPTFIGVLSVWRGDPLAIRIGILSPEQLQALAMNARRLFVGAYDGEGYLFWTRPSEVKEPGQK